MSMTDCNLQAPNGTDGAKGEKGRIGSTGPKGKKVYTHKKIEPTEKPVGWCT